jgi:hypothetical protein
MHPHHARHRELIDDALSCIGQFDSITVRQLTFWLYGETNPSTLSCTHRLVRTLLAKKLILRRQGGDGIQRVVLASHGAKKAGTRAGYHVPLLNAHLYAPVVEFLTIMRLQGFNVFGRGRIRNEAPKYLAADGLVLDTLDDGYAVVQIQNCSEATFEKIWGLKKLLPVRGIGPDHLLKRLKLEPALTYR